MAALFFSILIGVLIVVLGEYAVHKLGIGKCGGCSGK